MRVTRPLFHVDPGWLFILAGLALCVAGVLLPAQGDLAALQNQLALLQQEEARAYARLTAHADFVDEIERAEPAVITRLAAAQLNLVPEGDTPVLLAVSDTSPVTDWIDATVRVDIRAPQVAGISTLSRLANGPYRLWLFGGGIMAVFIGLLMGGRPASTRSRRRQGRAMDAARRWTDGSGESERNIVSAMRSLTAETVDLEEDELASAASERSALLTAHRGHDVKVTVRTRAGGAGSALPNHDDLDAFQDDELGADEDSGAAPLDIDDEEALASEIMSSDDEGHDAGDGSDADDGSDAGDADDADEDAAVPLSRWERD